MAKHLSGPASGLVVYTALLGGGQFLREAPLAAESTADFLCFTDDPGLRSHTWQVIPVEPRLSADPVRSERYLKIEGHPALAGYDRSLWVDSSVELRALPESFVDNWLERADVAAPLHTFHRSVLAEAEDSIDLGKDDHLRVFEQLAHYVLTSPAAVEANPHWTALLARRRTADVAAAMTIWWEHVLRYSRRDQLSFGVVMAAAGMRLNSVPLGNLRSPLHHWPDGWECRFGDRPKDEPLVGDEPRAVGRHAIAPAALRAEIETALGVGQDDDAWIRDAETRLAEATATVRRLRDRLQDERGA